MLILYFEHHSGAEAIYSSPFTSQTPAPKTRIEEENKFTLYAATSANAFMPFPNLLDELELVTAALDLF